MSIASISKARARKGLAAAVPQGARNVPREVWIVIDEDGRPHYSAMWPEACHEHIADAIQDHAIVEAGQWVVRRYVLAENQP